MRLIANGAEHDLDEAEDPGIELLAALHKVLGYPRVPGECRDCFGLGIIPDVDEAIRTDRGVWQICPTCQGHRHGGSA